MQAIRVKLGRDRNGNRTMALFCQAKRKRRQCGYRQGTEDTVRDFIIETVRELKWDNYGTWSIGQLDDDTYIATCATAPHFGAYSTTLDLGT